MKQIKIENWNAYGDYMMFANFVDETKKWVLLTCTSRDIIAMAKDDGMKAFTKLLDKNKIKYIQL